jgi:hypothetical protein
VRHKRRVLATVATGCAAETVRARRCFGGPTGEPEELGHNLAMPPSDSEANGTDRDVLTSLPRTRPARRSAKRDRPGRAAGGASAASGSSRATAASGASTAPETAAGQKPAVRSKTTASRAKPKAASSRAKAASTRRSRTTAAAKPRAASRATAATAEAASVAAETAVPPAGYATEAPAHGHGPGPFAVVTTAVQAAGEIAQIGATLWGQAVRSAISRLPRP